MARQLVDIIKERAWMLILQGTVRKEASRKQLEKELKEQEWIDCQLGDGDMDTWADWDRLEQNIAKEKKTGTMLDWLTRKPHKEKDNNMDVDEELEEEMELDQNLPEMEKAKRLWKVSQLKLEWAGRGESWPGRRSGRPTRRRKAGPWNW